MAALNSQTDEASVNGERQRHYKMLPFHRLEVHLKRLREETDEADGDIVEKLGYTRTVISAWRKNNEAPEVAVHAAECFVRRLATNSKTTALIITSNDADKVQAIKTLAKALGAGLQEVVL